MEENSTQKIKRARERTRFLLRSPRRVPCFRPAFLGDARQRLGICGAVIVIFVWLVTGPTFHFSDTWQLIINTATTVVTFLMVFLIQNTQNRDAKAMHLKLDELIRAIKGARNKLVDLEELSDEELSKLEKEFHRLHKTSGVTDTHVAPLESQR